MKNCLDEIKLNADKKLFDFGRNMLKRIINLEKYIDENGDDIDPILKKRNIKVLISEMCNAKQWSDIVASNINSEQIRLHFLSHENNITVYRNIFSICHKDAFNLSELNKEIISMCAEQKISIEGKEIKKFICSACICGFLNIESTQRLDIENLEKIDFPKEIVNTVYIIENILCSNDTSTLGDRDIAVHIDEIESDFWTDFMLYTIAKMQSYFDVIQSYQEKLKSLDSLEENINERFKKHVQEFYGKTMEIIGIFIAVFSLIGFNLFRDNNMSVHNILILNLSCILGIVTMFFLIDYIMNKKMKGVYYIVIIVLLVVGILLVTDSYTKDCYFVKKIFFLT